MKKRNLLFIPLLFIFFGAPVYADSLETVRVIKIYDTTDDIIIERSSGERLLIQHNRQCSSMNTEFPVKLLWDGDKVKHGYALPNYRNRSLRRRCFYTSSRLRTLSRTTLSKPGFTITYFTHPGSGKTNTCWNAQSTLCRYPEHQPSRL